MKTAICPGSFDPITLGHLDIITRASGLFDRVTVLVVVNVDKTPTFTLEERCEMIREAVAHLPNVQVDTFCGLLADYLTEQKVDAVVKGLRAVSDFEYEFQMALINKKLVAETETVFLTTAAQNMYLSSSIVRQVGKLGGDISAFVPACVHDRIRAKLTAIK